MIMDPTAFKLTNHAIKRLRERFPMIARKIDDLPPYLKVKATYGLLKDAVDVTEQLIDAETSRWFDKHGEAPHYFFRTSNILFIGRAGECNSIVTVVNWAAHNIIIEKIRRGEWREEAY